MTIHPCGNRILVMPMSKETYVTEKNIELVDNELEWGEVVEFAPMFDDIYKKGDIVMYPKGAGISQAYNKKPHTWLNGNGATSGDIWGMVTKDK